MGTWFLPRLSNTGHMREDLTERKHVHSLCVWLRIRFFFFLLLKKEKEKTRLAVQQTEFLTKQSNKPNYRQSSLQYSLIYLMV